MVCFAVARFPDDVCFISLLQLGVRWSFVTSLKVEPDDSVVVGHNWTLSACEASLDSDMLSLAHSKSVDGLYIHSPELA